MEQQEEEAQDGEQQEGDVEEDPGPLGDCTGGYQDSEETDAHPPPSADLNGEATVSPGAHQPQVADGPPRARHLFKQACSQVRVQSSKEGRRKTGLLEVLQMATEDREQKAAEVRGQGEGKAREGRAAPGQEVLPMQVSIDALRREFRRELRLLRAELQGYTDRAVRDMESRLLAPTVSLHRRLLYGKAASEHMLHAVAGSLEKRHKSQSVPSLLPGKNLGPARTVIGTRPVPRRTKSESLSPPGEASTESPESKGIGLRNSRLRKAAGSLPLACPPVHRPTKQRYKQADDVPQ